MESKENMEKALFRAIRSQDRHGVMKLLEKGANPNAVDSHGLTPLTDALMSPSVKIAGDIVKMLVKAGADVNLPDTGLYTPLMCACMIDNDIYVNETIDIIEFLLKNGASMSIDAQNKEEGFTALHWAIRNCNNKIVKILLENGATPDISDNEENTPLLLAARCPEEGGVKLIKMLLQTGKVNVNHANIKGETALFWAVGGGEDNMRLLLREGAEPNIQSKNGSTALLEVINSFCDNSRYGVNTDDLKRMIMILLNAGADLNIEANNG